MRIAYQGEPGAYSEAAALRFNPGADPVPRQSFDDVFHAVAQGEATHGILPIENTIGGSIHRNYDLLLEHELPIVAEVKQPIVHHLIVREGTGLEDLRKVYSHPQGLAQCERFLRTLDGVEMVPTYDTAGSAKMSQGAEAGRLRRHRVRAGGGGVRAGDSQDLRTGLRGQLHPVPDRQPGPAAARHARQDDHRLHRVERSRARCSRR